MARAPLVLLHGSNGCAGELAPLASTLSEFDLVVPNLLGHGGRPVPEPLRFGDMVDDLAAAMDARKLGPSHLVGYSFGGSVALGLASREPERVLSVTAIATRYGWDRAVVSHVVHLTDPERLARPGNPRREQMEAAHGEDRWRQVTLANRALFASFAGEGPPLTEAEAAAIGTPALILSGDTDPLVPEAEVKRLAATLPNARFGLWPGPAHPLVNVPLVQLKYAIRAFIEEVDEKRFAPGPPLDLASRLVDGGLTGVAAGLRMRRGRSPG